jgi:DnaJ-class molecular chaperone
MIGPGMMAQTHAPCDVCSGQGTRVLRACKPCQGKRFIEKEKVLDIRIVPGMIEGQTLVFENECSDTTDFEQPGDVVLTLKRVDPPQGDVDTWEWRGADLWIRKRIQFAESILGFRREIEGHPSGKPFAVSWTKSPLVHGAVLQAPGWGMPNKNGGHGTCYIQILVDPPECREWTTEEREGLNKVFGMQDSTSSADISLTPAFLESKTTPTRLENLTPMF